MSFGHDEVSLSSFDIIDLTNHLYWIVIFLLMYNKFIYKIAQYCNLYKYRFYTKTEYPKAKETTKTSNYGP